MNIPQPLNDRLTKIHATYRHQCRVSGDYPNQRSVQVCEIIDLTTNRVYAKGEGDTKIGSLVAALDLAQTTLKPLTPAQQADPLLKAQLADGAQAAAQNDELKAENDELKAKLEALEKSREDSDGTTETTETVTEPQAKEPQADKPKADKPKADKPKAKGTNTTKAG